MPRKTESKRRSQEIAVILMLSACGGALLYYIVAQFNMLFSVLRAVLPQTLCLASSQKKLQFFHRAFQ